MAAQSTPDIYRGAEETLVIAIDLGTTHTAASFVHLLPNEKIEIKMVTSWPGHAAARGEAKIPTLIAYRYSTPELYGVEAKEVRDDPNYEIAEWFKLHLHPNSMQNSGTENFEIPDLPFGISLSTVYAHFLKWIYQSTQKFIEETIPNGSTTWRRLESGINVVLATPNGWDTTQHGFLRKCCIEAGFLTEKDADLRLDFVTEGEASVHYVLAHTVNTSWLRPRVTFAVTDAGGSTVDSTLYECTSMSPRLILKEVCASECTQAGGVFVDREARQLLTRKLAGSPFGDQDVVNLMVSRFEEKTKRVFDGVKARNVIEFGSPRDNEPGRGIIRGQLTLTPAEVKSAFDSVVNRAIESCMKLIGSRQVNHLLLVGGFGDSPYLQKRLKDTFGPRGVEVVIIDQAPKKAAAEGAAIWFVKQSVVARAARFTVGGDCQTIYNPLDSEHRRRQGQTEVGHDGETRIKHKYDTLIERNSVMAQDQRVEREYHRTWKDKPDLSTFLDIVFAWDGIGPTNWCTDESGTWLSQMRLLCILSADLSALESSLVLREGKNGARYWRVDFKVVMYFGGTKLRARLEWEEGGRVREGPVSVLSGSVV